MRITATYGEKVPGDEEYSSRQCSISIETEPPPEVAQDAVRLKAYVENVFVTCRARVDDQIVRGRTSTAPARTAPARTTTRRPPGAARRAAPAPDAPAASRNGHGDDLASPKQVNFVRSLAQQAGYSASQLGALAEEVLGVPVRDLRSLTKKQASALIDQLREPAA